jgi:hypothetical protein
MLAVPGGRPASEVPQECHGVPECSFRSTKYHKNYLRYLRMGNVAAQGMQEALAGIENGRGCCSRDARGSCGN